MLCLLKKFVIKIIEGHKKNAKKVTLFEKKFVIKIIEGIGNDTPQAANDKMM